MIASELIQILQKLPPDTPILIWGCADDQATGDIHVSPYSDTEVIIDVNSWYGEELLPGGI